MDYHQYLKENLHLFRYEAATEQEVAAMESQLGYSLPEAVRQFMVIMGNHYDDINNSSSTGELDECIDNQQLFLDILTKYSIILTDPVFVFNAYDEIVYVKLNEGEDPTVWRFWELMVQYGTNIPAAYYPRYIDGPFSKVDDRFSNYISRCVDSKKAYNAKYSINQT